MYIKKDIKNKLTIVVVVLAIAVAIAFGVQEVNNMLPEFLHIDSPIKISESFGGNSDSKSSESASAAVDDRPYVEYGGVKYYDENSIRKAETEGKIGNATTAINKLNQKISQYEANKKEEVRKATNAKKGIIIQVTGAFDMFETGAYVRQGFTDFDRETILKDFVTNKGAWQSAKVERISLFGKSLKSGMTAKEIKEAWEEAGVQCYVYTVSAKDLKDLTTKYNRADMFDINK